MFNLLKAGIKKGIGFVKSGLIQAGIQSVPPLTPPY